LSCTDEIITVNSAKLQRNHLQLFSTSLIDLGLTAYLVLYRLVAEFAVMLNVNGGFMEKLYARKRFLTNKTIAQFFRTRYQQIQAVRSRSAATGAYFWRWSRQSGSYENEPA